jgi:hypothetical protein
MTHPSPDAEPSKPAGARAPRAVLVAGGAIAALIGLSLVVVLAVPRGPTAYPPGSPEAAFQAFYIAYETGDVEGAYALLGSSVTGRVTLAEYRQLDSEQQWQRHADRRVLLLGAEVTDDRAVLRVRLDEFTEGGLGGNRYSWERTIRMVREDGNWLIDEPIVGIESVAYGF